MNLIGGNWALRLKLLTSHLVSTEEISVAAPTSNYKNKIPKHLHNYFQ